MNREPLVTAATLTAIVSAIIALLVAFNVSVTQEQTAAILGIAAVVAPLIVAAVTRGQVTPTADPKNDAGVSLVPARTPEIGVPR